MTLHEHLEPLRKALSERRRSVVLSALEAEGWNMSKSAIRLGIARSYLYLLVEQYQLEPSDEASSYR